jgi:hypothetical protein
MFFSVWQLLRRSSKGTRRRKRRRIGWNSRNVIAKLRRRLESRRCKIQSLVWLGRDLLGSRAAAGLRQREWNRAHSDKQKQVKCASNKMRFDRGINLFFHLVLFFRLSS